MAMAMMIRKRRRAHAGGVEGAEQVLIVLEEEALGVLGEWGGPGHCPRCPLEVGSFYVGPDGVVPIPGV